ITKVTIILSDTENIGDQVEGGGILLFFSLHLKLQAPAYQAPAPQTQGVSKEEFSAYVKANDAMMRNMQTQGTLPSNTISNPRSDLKAITTQSGVSYDGPQILPPTSFLPKVVEDEPEATKDTVNPTNNGSTKDIQPQAPAYQAPAPQTQGVSKEEFSAYVKANDAYLKVPKHQDSLNSATDGNFLDKMPRECLAIRESKSKVNYSLNKLVVAKVSTNTSTFGISPDVAELKDMVKALLLDKKSQSQSPAPVKAVEESCVTCGGPHSYHNFPATDGNIYHDNFQEFVSQASAVNYNQGNTSYRPPMMSNQIRPPGPAYQPPVFQPPACQAPAYQAPAPQTQGVSKEDFSAYVKAKDVVMRNMHTQGQNMQNQLTNLTDLITKFVNSNSASTSSSGTLPSNTIANPRSDLKAITTRSEATKDTVNPTNNESTEDVQPQVVQSEPLILTSDPVTSPIFKPAIAPISALKPNPKASIPYPSGRNDERNREKANNQIKKFYQIFKDMSMAECLALADLGASINLMTFSVWKRLSLPDLTPTCMTLELSDRSISHPVRVAEDVYVKVGSFYFSADFVVVDFDADPRVPLILGISFLKTERALIVNYSDLTAKRIDVIDMACEEYSEDVLGFFDTISSGNPTLYYDLIVSTNFSTLTPFGNSDFLLEEVDAFLAIEDDPTSLEFYQPYLDPEGDILLLEAFLNDDPSPPPNQGNYFTEVYLPPHLEYAFLEGNDKFSVIIAKDLSVEEKTALIMVLKSHKRAIAWILSDIKEVIKHLEVGLIYPIFDSPWVSPVHCVPKKGGFTVVENEDNELIPTRLVTGWRVCIDYLKLNEATRKDHFLLPFMDEMLERLAGNQYYCFLDGFSGYFQIPIDPKDQEKTAFTCPYGMFAYRRMPFGLCNALGMFQRCMIAIFYDMIEKTIEVFMDDFSVLRILFKVVSPI
nr:reverse transcriptase domain-containing protein [Tanacetum cinerariifolium]